jgi:iron complex transport system substrate-binding protein
VRTGCALALLASLLCACSPPSEPPAVDATYSRVVTLAPNLTELVFAAGAGGALVGVSAYSDYPAAAGALPEVGDAFAVDREELATLEPDLLLAWESGTPAHVVDELRRGGYRVETIRTRSLEDVAGALRRIGELTGHTDTAERAADSYTDALAAIGKEYSNRKPIRVFYQVSARPLYTVNGEHYVSELIRLCGGRNIFADLGDLAPAVDVEAVVARDPEVMLASTDAGTDAFAQWARWPALAANRYDNDFLMPADEIGRATPRLVAAARALCEALDTARAHRAVPP